jgi:hypothetical protein
MLTVFFWMTDYIIMIFSSTENCYGEMSPTKFAFRCNQPRVNWSSSIWDINIIWKTVHVYKEQTQETKKNKMAASEW